MTPFLFYFCNEVYNRLQVDAVPPKTDLEVYQTALAEGKITEKERMLWEYVLSAYGAEEFTTKQLEKDFRNAAYATIRTFVMKFHEMGLLTARKAGNRVFYHVGGTSDGLAIIMNSSLSSCMPHKSGKNFSDRFSIILKVDFRSRAFLNL